MHSAASEHLPKISKHFRSNEAQLLDELGMPDFLCILRDGNTYGDPNGDLYGENLIPIPMGMGIPIPTANLL